MKAIALITKETHQMVVFMGKRSDYKKKTTFECHWCDYRTCRKGHKCKWYKQWVKKVVNKKRKQDKD
jgi:aminoglycoside phosphotransferase family enzyme